MSDELERIVRSAQRRAEVHRAEVRLGFMLSAHARRFSEPRWWVLDHAVETQLAALLRMRPFSRWWWRGLRHLAWSCVLCEFHRAAGTEREVVGPDPRAFTLITGVTS